MSQRLSSSELDDIEAGHGLEVTHVECGDIEAEIEGCSSDEQVWEVDADARPI